VLHNERPTIGHHHLLAIDVYNTRSNPGQLNFAHQVSKRVVAVLWITDTDELLSMGKKLLPLNTTTKISK